jgi:hypothetical protein
MQPNNYLILAPQKYSKPTTHNNIVDRPDTYKYSIVQGNNSRLIKDAMDKRDGWSEASQPNTNFNFKWQPVSSGIRFNRLNQSTTK